jgi:hypothetical protein
MQLLTEEEILAPPEKVWQVLTDFSRYHEWNPFITSLAGTLEPGQSLEVIMSSPGGSEYRFQPEVLKVDPGREFRWRGKLWASFLFSGEHFFQLTATEHGTRLVHGENFSGILVHVARRALGEASRGFIYMNRALKRRVETNSGLSDVA